MAPAPENAAYSLRTREDLQGTIQRTFFDFPRLVVVLIPPDLDEVGILLCAVSNLKVGDKFGDQARTSSFPGPL